jgi:hypothetical protein
LWVPEFCIRFWHEERINLGFVSHMAYILYTFKLFIGFEFVGVDKINPGSCLHMLSLVKSNRKVSWGGELGVRIPRFVVVLDHSSCPALCSLLDVF